MSCLKSTSPIDISSSKVAGECVEKCSFTYKCFCVGISSRHARLT